MIEDLSNRKPPLMIRRMRAVRRGIYWRLSAVLPLILVAEFPKSGGTWIATMVASAAGYRFPRNNLSPYGWRAVLLGHHTYSRSYRNVLVVFRDGRDVMVSAYHHFLFENEWNDPRAVANTRKKIGFADDDAPYAKFNEFLEWMFNGYSQRFARFSWPEFVRSWIDVEVPTVFYEDLLVDPVRELQRLCRELGVLAGVDRLKEIVEENSFGAKSKGTPARQGMGTFVRKGIAGDWKNVFDSTSVDIFQHFAGDELIALGYERDSNWVATYSGEP